MQTYTRNLQKITLQKAISEYTENYGCTDCCCEICCPTPEPLNLLDDRKVREELYSWDNLTITLKHNSILFKKENVLINLGWNSVYLTNIHYRDY